MESSPMLFLSSKTRTILLQLFLQVYLQDKKKAQSLLHELLSLIRQNTALESACLAYILYVDFNTYYDHWLQLQGGADKRVHSGENRLMESCIDRETMEYELIQFMDRYVHR